MHAPDLMILGSDHIATHTVYMGPDGIKSSLFYDTKFGAPLCVCVCGVCPRKCVRLGSGDPSSGIKLG